MRAGSEEGGILTDSSQRQRLGVVEMEQVEIVDCVCDFLLFFVFVLFLLLPDVVFLC